jgi:hypothetical protein
MAWNKNNINRGTVKYRFYSMGKEIAIGLTVEFIV